MRSADIKSPLLTRITYFFSQFVANTVQRRVGEGEERGLESPKPQREKPQKKNHKLLVGLMVPRLGVGFTNTKDLLMDQEGWHLKASSL